MKKIILFVSLVSCFLSSCSKESSRVEVEPSTDYATAFAGTYKSSLLKVTTEHRAITWVITRKSATEVNIAESVFDEGILDENGLVKEQKAVYENVLVKLNDNKISENDTLILDFSKAKVQGSNIQILKGKSHLFGNRLVSDINLKSAEDSPINKTFELINQNSM
ncbi:hypothetical protein FEM33_04115 [Dyadobacter flavalbus]|uniref:Uncharacterized protein n=1 Tax=Dyadobacter flavalbus TaxID=2579942 RepID=A0A5M8R021_9BACT|nr:hypothetical protein [Dyadobacter flavalbus]KAA6440998.1 hypothetical protein FEM33_04115 [Dyadobacter flavalbus]